LKLFVINEANASSEQTLFERRCAATPNTVKKLIRMGCTVEIESGAGHNAGYDDNAYLEAGAKTAYREQGIANADAVLYVNQPSETDLTYLKPNTFVLGHFDPFFAEDLVKRMAELKLTALSIEMIPRSTRAQKMDALSSQASLAGYVMVLQAALALPKIFPMMMTPSGQIKPAKVFVIGAGVAGLQAIATAKRMGANVLAYDTRPVVAEQVESLGAKFLKIDIGETGQTKDGYAKELTDEQKQIQQDAQKDAIADADIVITTAQLFGRKPPQLINKDTLALMKAGSVVVDMAAQSGGNVEGSVPGETVEVNGVTVIGNGSWSQEVARDATDMYANNCFNLIDEFFDEESKALNIDLDDEILAQSIITHDGELCNDMLKKHYEGGN
jgi:NAD(P) transhydrogenase subunit alpha